MKNNPSEHVTASAPARTLAAQDDAPHVDIGSGGVLQAWTDFWFRPAAPLGLHCLRFLTGLLLISWLFPLGGQLEAFFSLNGFFDREAYFESARIPGGAPVPFGWSVLYLGGDNIGALTALYWGAIVVFLLFAVGLWTRVTGILTWVMAASFLANPAASYDPDYLLVILAFYLMLGYLLLGLWSRPLSRRERILGPSDTFLFSFLLGKKADGGSEPSYAANLVIRLMQIHFAIIVVTSGLHKLQFGDWWNGTAFFFPLHPPYETTADVIRSEAAHARLYLSILSLGQYIVLAWQIGFPLFAWKRRWRPVLLGGALVGWIGSFFLYQLPLFGPVYLVGCLSFLAPEEWAWITSKLGQTRNLFQGGLPAAAEKKVKVRARS